MTKNTKISLRNFQMDRHISKIKHLIKTCHVILINQTVISEMYVDSRQG